MSCIPWWLVRKPECTWKPYWNCISMLSKYYRPDLLVSITIFITSRRHYKFIEGRYPCEELSTWRILASCIMAGPIWDTASSSIVHIWSSWVASRSIEATPTFDGMPTITRLCDKQRTTNRESKHAKYKYPLSGIRLPLFWGLSASISSESKLLLARSFPYVLLA